MATAEEFREFASECLRWATEVDSDEDRQAFLDMARDWTLAAMRLEGSLVPLPSPELDKDASLSDAPRNMLLNF
jgi:hypothetical protein